MQGTYNKMTKRHCQALNSLRPNIINPKSNKHSIRSCVIEPSLCCERWEQKMHNMKCTSVRCGAANKHAHIHTLNITANGGVLGVCCSIEKHRLHLCKSSRQKGNPVRQDLFSPGRQPFRKHSDCLDSYWDGNPGKINMLLLQVVDPKLKKQDNMSLTASLNCHRNQTILYVRRFYVILYF